MNKTRLGIHLGYKLRPVRNGRGYRTVYAATKEDALKEQERLNKKTGKYWMILANVL